jgi:hypothetical protein
MIETNDYTSSTDRDSNNCAYNFARAAWHSHRAACAVDSSTKALHEKFASLYRARAKSADALSGQSPEL